MKREVYPVWCDALPVKRRYAIKRLDRINENNKKRDLIKKRINKLLTKGEDKK